MKMKYNNQNDSTLKHTSESCERREDFNGCSLIGVISNAFNGSWIVHGVSNKSARWESDSIVLREAIDITSLSNLFDKTIRSGPERLLTSYCCCCSHIDHQLSHPLFSTSSNLSSFHFLPRKDFHWLNNIKQNIDVRFFYLCGSKHFVDEIENYYRIHSLPFFRRHHTRCCTCSCLFQSTSWKAKENPSRFLI